MDGISRLLRSQQKQITTIPIYSIKRQLIGLISRRADAKGSTRCVILDDTDLPKRGMKAEGLGRVFSHTAMKCILGFKASHKA